MTRGTDRRRLAAFVGVLALLLQQGLLPVLHFALGGELSDCMQAMSASPHAHHDGSGGGDLPGDTDHGPCHFCRILGAALPPPPIAELGRLEPTRVVLARSPAEVRPASSWSSPAHYVRGPPSSSDPQSKIAIV